MTKIQVFEHQSISYTGRYAIPEFNQKQYHAFESYFKKNERTPFFDLIPKGVRFKSYVGVIQIGDLVIEVLPKADRKRQSSASKETWPVTSRCFSTSSYTLPQSVLPLARSMSRSTSSS